MGIPKIFANFFKKRGFRDVITKRLPYRVSSLLIDVNGILHEVAQKTFQYGAYEITPQERSKITQTLNDNLKKIKDLFILKSAEENKEENKEENIEISNKLQVEIVKLIGEEEYFPDMTFEQFEKIYNLWAVEDYDLRDPKTYTNYMKLFKRNLYSHLNSLFNNTNPINLVILAVDGTAPMSKINQQRSRRFKSYSKPGKFDSNSITPGTQFMKEVDVMLNLWCQTISLSVDEVIYSSYLQVGEAEHKLMDFIREGYLIGFYSHVIYGLDADLIMLSLLAPINNLYLFREQKSIEGQEIRQDIVNITALKKQLKSMGITPEDFVLITFFLGNDFLAHQPSLGDLSISVEILIDAKNQITNSKGEPLNLVVNGIIVWDRLYRFLEIMAKKESDLLLDEYKKTKVYPFRTMLVDGVITQHIDQNGIVIVKFDYDIFRSAWYTGEFNYRKSTPPDWYGKIMGEDFKISSADIDEMCKQYLIGISWVFNYYTKGLSSVSVDWFYPYYHTPLFSDLALKMDVVSKNLGEITGWEKIKDTYIMNPILQLLSVLPKTSKKLIPKEYWKYMNNYFPNYYPNDFILERDGQNEEWLAISILPFVNPEKIRNEVKLLDRDLSLQIDPKTEQEYGFVIYSREDDVKRKEKIIKNKERIEGIKKVKDLAPKKKIERKENGNKYQGIVRGRGRGIRGRGSRGLGSRGRGSRGRGSRGRGRGERRSHIAGATANANAWGESLL